MYNTVAVDTTQNPIHKMTKEEAQQKSDTELLQMIKDAKGHTGNDWNPNYRDENPFDNWDKSIDKDKNSVSKNGRKLF